MIKAVFSKIFYYSKDGEKKINSYRVYLPKEIVKKAKLENEKEIYLEAKENTIIIKKV